MRSRDMIRMIEANGWYRVAIKGSHHQYQHPYRPERVTVPLPDSDLPRGMINSILRQAGLR